MNFSNMKCPVMVCPPARTDRSRLSALARRLACTCPSIFLHSYSFSVNLHSGSFSVFYSVMNGFKVSDCFILFMLSLPQGRFVGLNAFAAPSGAPMSPLVFMFYVF